MEIQEMTGTMREINDLWCGSSERLPSSLRNDGRKREGFVR